MKSLDSATAARAAQFFHYDQSAGKFYLTARDNTGQQFITGTEAGLVTPVGVRLTFERQYIAAHHLAWFLVHGAWPTHKVSHLNGDKTDNRPANLASPLSLQDHAQARTTVKARSAAVAVNFLESIGVTQEQLQDHALQVIRDNQGEARYIDALLVYGRIDKDTHRTMLENVKANKRKQVTQRVRVNT